jgi:hypothetical protein
MSDPNSTSPDILSDGPGKDILRPADLAQKYSVGLQEILVSRVCSQEENSFFLPY